MSSLCNDSLSVVFSFLEPQDIGRCAVVNKQWNREVERARTPISSRAMISYTNPLGYGRTHGIPLNSLDQVQRCYEAFLKTVEANQQAVFTCKFWRQTTEIKITLYTGELSSLEEAPCVEKAVEAVFDFPEPHNNDLLGDFGSGMHGNERAQSTGVPSNFGGWVRKLISQIFENILGRFTPVAPGVIVRTRHLRNMPGPIVALEQVPETMHRQALEHVYSIQKRADYKLGAIVGLLFVVLSTIFIQRNSIL